MYPPGIAVLTLFGDGNGWCFELRVRDVVLKSYWCPKGHSLCSIGIFSQFKVTGYSGILSAVLGLFNLSVLVQLVIICRRSIQVKPLHLIFATLPIPFYSNIRCFISLVLLCIWFFQSTEAQFGTEGDPANRAFPPFRGPRRVCSTLQAFCELGVVVHALEAFVYASRAIPSKATCGWLGASLFGPAGCHGPSFFRSHSTQARHAFSRGHGTSHPCRLRQQMRRRCRNARDKRRERNPNRKSDANEFVSLFFSLFLYFCVEASLSGPRGLNSWVNSGGDGGDPRTEIRVTVFHEMGTGRGRGVGWKQIWRGRVKDTDGWVEGM